MTVDPRDNDVTFEHVAAVIDKAAISDKARTEMYNERRFGVDGGAGPNIAPAAIDEKDWKVSMGRMRDLGRDGGLVFMPANNTPVEGGLIGQIESGTDIEPINYESRGGDGVTTMKTLQMTDVREVHPNDNTTVLKEVNTGRYTVHWIDEHRSTVIDTYTQLY